MANQATKNITLSGSMIKEKEGVVILPLEKWERSEREKTELRSALEAILAGELALQRSQIRPFKDFLKAEFPQYAKKL